MNVNVNVKKKPINKLLTYSPNKKKRLESIQIIYLQPINLYFCWLSRLWG